MKSFYTHVGSCLKAAALAAVAVVLTVDANGQYRKSWDFTKWSATTVSNLKACVDYSKMDGKTGNTTLEWSDAEKNNASAPTDLSKDNCFWKWGTQATVDAPVTLSANGQTIEELDGLLYTNKDAGSLAIAVNYKDANPNDAAFGPYEGASYLWLGGSKKQYFIIQHVALGETIKAGVESHKTTDARGITLHLGRGNGGVADKELKDPDGNAVSAPKTYTEQTWQVPTEVDESLLNEDGTVDIQVYNTNGCHLYFITVGDGGGEVEKPAVKIAYLNNTAVAASADADDVADAFNGASDRIAYTTIESDKAITLEDLAEYEALVVSSFVGADDAVVPSLKNIIGYFPVLNLSKALYGALGLGEIVESDELTFNIPEDKQAYSLFTDVTVDEGFPFFTKGTVPAVKLGDYFKNDDVLATVGEGLVAMHQHNASRNTYVYIPFDADNIDYDVVPSFIPNAALYVAQTKRTVTTLSAPSINTVFNNLNTDVTIIGSAGATVYYTLDGTEPKVESPVYSEPFNVTEATTVKAFQVQDGYYDSPVATANVEIKQKAVAPEITLTHEADKTIITLSTTTSSIVETKKVEVIDDVETEVIEKTETAKIFYTFKEGGEKDRSKCKEYTEPIELSVEPGTIYAFTEAKNFIDSDIAEEYVSINSITAQTLRADVVSYFNPGEEAAWKLNPLPEGATSDSKTCYPWGKSATSYQDPANELSREPKMDGDTQVTVEVKNGDEVTNVPQYNVTFGKKADAYKESKTNEGYTGMNADWTLYSEGQVLVHEFANGPTYAYSTSTARWFSRPEDMIGNHGTKGHLSWKGTGSYGEPEKGIASRSDAYNAGVKSVVTFKAPFDVVSVYSCYGGTGNYVVEVSKDGVNWTKVANWDDCPKATMRKDRCSVNEEGEYYVKAYATKGSNFQLYDMYIMNNGEESQKYEGGNTAIDSILAGEAGEVVAEEYYTLSGMRLAQPAFGVNIVRTVYADGTVKTAKVIVK